MNGCCVDNVPTTVVLPNPDLVPDLQPENDLVSARLVDVMCWGTESSAVGIGSDLTLPIQNDVGHDDVVMPGYNSRKEDVGTIDRCSEFTALWVVPSSHICDDVTIYDVGQKRVVIKEPSSTTGGKTNPSAGVYNKCELKTGQI